MIRVAALIVLAPIALALSGAAAPAVADENCARDDQSQMGMNLCAAADADAADARLNRIYRALAAQSEGREKTALRDAQRAWLAYRDKECDYETIGSEGGSIRPMEFSQCITARTDARIAEFEKFLGCVAGDKDCGK